MRTEAIVTETIVDVDILARNWGAIVLRGVAGVLFGLVTFFAPGISLAALVLVFGLYALADGVLAIVTALRRRPGRWGSSCSRGSRAWRPER